MKRALLIGFALFSAANTSYAQSAGGEILHPSCDNVLAALRSAKLEQDVTYTLAGTLAGAALGEVSGVFGTLSSSESARSEALEKGYQLQENYLRAYLRGLETEKEYDELQRRIGTAARGPRAASETYAQYRDNYKKLEQIGAERQAELESIEDLSRKIERAGFKLPNVLAVRARAFRIGNEAALAEELTAARAAGAELAGAAEASEGAVARVGARIGIGAIIGGVAGRALGYLAFLIPTAKAGDMPMSEYLMRHPFALLDKPRAEACRDLSQIPGLMAAASQHVTQVYQDSAETKNRALNEARALRRNLRISADDSAVRRAR